MKVVRIIARLNVGGPARHVAWLEAGLRRAGVESLLVAGTVPPGEDDMSYFADALGVKARIIPQMSREISVKDAVTVWKLYRLLVRERPDIVHTHTAKAGTVGRTAGLLYRWLVPSALWGRPRRCRFVHTYHGHIFHSYYGRAKTNLFLAVEKLLARLATDRIVVISPQQYREIHERFGVGRASQFSVVPLGMDIGAYAGWAARRDLARSELGAERNDVLVGIVGRLTEVKNHRLFLEAVALDRRSRAEGLKSTYATNGEGSADAAATTAAASASSARDGGRVRFVVIGEGHLRRELEDYAKALGIADDVIFTGLRNDPENFYPALDVVALTSLNEGTPLTLIEAMANARAVVATGVGGVVDLLGAPLPGKAGAVVESETGYTICERGVRVRPRDAESFCRALAQLLGEPELRRELGECGRRFVELHYSLERLLADVLSLYEELLNPASRDAERAAVAGTAKNMARVVETARLKGD